jgi:hypothetical protein
MNRYQFASGFVPKNDSEPDQQPNEIPQGHTFYKLDGRRVVPAKNIEAAEMIDDVSKRIIEKTRIGDSEISTVFLVVNHGWGEFPILFETMIFGGNRNSETYRCSTYAQAEAQHKMAIDLVRGDKKWIEND